MKQFSRALSHDLRKPHKGYHTWNDFVAGFPSFPETFFFGFTSRYNPSLPNSSTIRKARTPQTSLTLRNPASQLTENYLGVFSCGMNVIWRSTLDCLCPNPPIQVIKRSRKSVVKWLQTGPVLLPHIKRHFNFLS